MKRREVVSVVQLVKTNIKWIVALLMFLNRFYHTHFAIASYWRILAQILIDVHSRLLLIVVENSTCTVVNTK